MTKAEATLFFTVPEGEEMEDFFDEQFFACKQFFLTKTPLAKVFVSKLNKWQREDQAFHVLQEIEWESYPNLEVKQMVFPEDLLEAFTQYEKEKTSYKLMVLQAQTGRQLHEVVIQFLETVRCYHEKWFSEEVLDLEYGEVLSKEPDPMEMLSQIRSFNQEGGLEFQDVLKIGSNSFLLNEMKRVSLLIKKHGG